MRRADTVRSRHAMLLYNLQINYRPRASAVGLVWWEMTRSEQRVEVIPGPFEARIIRRGPRALHVSVSGELDLAMAPELDDVLRQAMAIADDIVIDLSAVKFMDSTGLYTIVGAVREAEANGIALRISSTLSPQVARLFEIVGMAHTLPLMDV